MTSRQSPPLLTTLGLALALGFVSAHAFAGAIVKSLPAPQEASKYKSTSDFETARRAAIESIGRGQLASDSFIARWFGELPEGVVATPMTTVTTPAGSAEILFARDGAGQWRKIEEPIVAGAPSGAGIGKALAVRAGKADASK